MVKKTINENFAATSQDMTGGGAFVQDPIDTTGGQTNVVNASAPPESGDGPTANVPGVGEVPKAAQLKALLMKLSTLPPEILAQIANEIDAGTDLEANPAGPTSNFQGQNLASISVKEDIEDMFKGETISEEFKDRAAVIFEAALGARAVVMRAEIEEEHKAEIETVVESVTETIVENIDKYLSYAAEKYIEENAITIDQSIESTIAESFMKDIFEVAKKYNINVPKQEVNVVEELSAQVAELTAKVDAQLNENIELNNRIKTFEKREFIDTVSEGLTLTQKQKLITLTENIVYEDMNEFQSKVSVLKENVTAKPVAVKSTSTPDGIPLMENEKSIESSDPMVRETLKLLSGRRA